jgi:Icc-related predicted phosphoesterase
MAPMRLLAVSDLHFEFHADGGACFVDWLEPEGIDVLVVAGDLTNADGLERSLELLCRRFPEVVYVHGNHEFYGAGRREVLATMASIARRLENLHWLDNGTVELGGRLFLGTPLWFQNDPRAPRALMSDFHAIDDFDAWFEAENDKAVAFLATHVREGAIVVTHMLPSPRSIAPAFEGSPLTPFFVCDVEEVVHRRKPALWIHGHTHVSCDYVLGDTRVICNPFGYARREENRAFDPRKIVDVGGGPGSRRRREG